jgi:hypothetical protein
MTVKKYKKKPIIIEAAQLWPDTVPSIYDWMDISGKGNFHGCGHGIDPTDGKFKITTLEGIMEAGVGDYIIKGLRGEFYPCKADIFYKSYEEQ